MASRTNLSSALQDYRELQNPVASSAGADSVRSQSDLVSRYYDVVTPFYEYAWGTSFHFSPRHAGERLATAQRLHEEGVGRLLDLRPGMQVADVGCGVGGPLVTIARATGASITGINNNAHQIRRGEASLSRAGLEASCRFLLADFMNVPLPEGHFDAAYSFEAMCHAPDTGRLFAEIFRLLRSGGEIAAIDWCLTERFDAADGRHRDVRERIESGNATPDLLATRQQVEAAEAAGFEVLTATDQAATSDPGTPWYLSLQGRDASLSSFARTPAGRRLTAAATAVLERLRIVPAGTAEAAELLNVAADALVEGGELGIFTPGFLVHARKPR
ncbi:MAG: methyltransferase domain-containing protein [Gammaproteobacteria bacterium]|nr:methyltransferase domain-containing protein [Gammaproteobacteria bacterium]